MKTVSGLREKILGCGIADGGYVYRSVNKHPETHRRGRKGKEERTVLFNKSTIKKDV